MLLRYTIPFFRKAILVTLLLLFSSGMPSAVMAVERNGSGAGAANSSDPVLIHHWNFNEIPNNVDFSTTEPELLNVSSRHYGAFLAYAGARWDRVNFATPINAREDPYVEEDDRALRLRNPAGSLTLHLPTKGYRDVVLRYAVMRTFDGAYEQQIAYSIDGGETYITEGLSTTQLDVDVYYDLVELDFSGIGGVDNNPGFQVRITLSGENSEPENVEGNQRFNNITLDGYVLEDEIRRSLIHYWDFDNIPNNVDFPTGLEISAGGILGGNSIVGGAWLRYDGARWDRVNEPTPFNARTDPYDMEEDRALRLRNPSGDFLLRMPTTGYKNVVVRYVVMRSGNGAVGQQIAYSTDGASFRTDGLVFSSLQIGLNYVLHELDFTGMEEVDDNPDFTLRITASGDGSEPGNEDGNQRFNHITVDAGSLVTSVDDGVRELPDRVYLEQNYPNPFNPATQIRFSLPEPMPVTLEVFDVTGRHIETLADRPMAAGSHTLTFNAEQLSSGIYLYRLQAGDQRFTRRMMFVK